MRFQERLLRRMQVGTVERRPTRHRPHREYLHLCALAAEVDPGLIPVDLSFLSHAVALRDECLPQHQPHLELALPHVITNGRFRDAGIRKLRQDPAIDAPGRMPLLARRPPIRLQHRVDEGRNRIQLRLGSCWILVRRRHCTGKCLTHHPAVHAELRRNPRDRPDPELMLPAEPLEQIHFGSPIHARSPEPSGTTVG